jgi:hypothetical protein
MSRFYGAIDGSAGRATRLGSPRSGLTTHAAGWKGAIRVTISAAGDDTDLFRVELVPWQNSGGQPRLLATGVLDASSGWTTDRQALDTMAELMSTEEWNADLMEPVFTLMRATGRKVGS